MLHITVDLEFFEDTLAYKEVENPPEIENVGIEGVERLLELFEKNDVRATFFAISEVAKKHPAMIERIIEGGHEIASHSKSHSSEVDVLEEGKKSKDELEDITGEEITGFRAPAFSIGRGELAELSKIGYEYDSSLVPCLKIPGWYGGRYTKKSLVEEMRGYEADGLIEKPPSVNPYLRLPISGFWIRLFGLRFIKWSLDKLLEREVDPILYFHPWELVDLPKIEGIPRRVYFRTGQRFQEYVEKILKMNCGKIPMEEGI